MEKSILIFKIAATVVLLFLTYKLLKVGPLDSLFILHNVNLIFHEAGHTVFGLFGEFIGFLGGMIGQLIIPLIFTIYFYIKKQLFSSLIMLWWFGENFLDLAPYIGDAQTQTINLIGGEHDFAYILGRLDLLRYDLLLQKSFTIIAVSLMSLAIILMTVFKIRTFLDSRTIIKQS